MHNSAQVPWPTIKSLQSIRDCHNPNTLIFKVADYAIHLILSGKRKEDQYTVRNALRDARRILERQHQRYCFHNLSHTEFDLGTEVLGQPKGLECLVSTEPSIERCLSAEQSVDTLKANTVHIKYAPPVLMAWRDGVTMSETAERLGISQGYVKKLRNKIRAAAHDCLPCR